MAETIGIIDPPIVKSWKQARIPQLLPKHRALLLNISNRELWIGARVVHAATTSPECTMCHSGDDSIEHTFVKCSLAQKVTESTHKMLSELDYAPNRLSASDILFGPQYQMTHDSRILWTVTRGHMLWSLWSVRAFSRSNDSPEREINVSMLESLVQYSFLTAC